MRKFIVILEDRDSYGADYNEVDVATALIRGPLVAVVLSVTEVPCD